MASPSHSLLIANLKRLRAERGLTGDKLGEAAGLSGNYIRQLETERTWASADSLDKIARALEVDCSELFRNPALERKPTNAEVLAIVSEALQERSAPPKPALVSVPAGVEAILGGLSESDANNLIRVMKDWVAHNVKTRSKSARA